MKNLLCFVMILIASDMQGQPRPKLAIGDTIKCGIVFFNRQEGSFQHILICTKVDISAGMKWYNGKYITTSANNNIIFGRQNAARVINVQGDSLYAATLARNFSSFTSGCDTGWYLPSRTELKMMYDSLAVKKKGGFSREGYWSSVEQSPADSTSKKPLRKAWVIDFLNGRAILNDKANKYHVRAVKEIFYF